MAFTQDFRTQRRNYEDGETRIGELDRLWYDSGTNSIRIGDGETPGGVVVGGGAGGGDYTLPTATTTVKGGVKIDGSTITINNQVISGFSGSYTDLTNKPTIPAAQVNSDWNASSGLAQILNKPTLFSGSYTDLTDKPTIPSAYTLPTATDTVLGGVKIDGTTITINGSGVITANYPDTLAELTDTNVAGASNNQVLTWNTSTSKWIPTTVNGVDTLPTGIAYYGSFYDITATQTATSQTTAYVVAIGQTAEANGVSIVSGNRITFAYAGTYEIEYSIQFHNVSNDASDVNVWFRKNGTDIADSNSRFTIPSRQNNNGYLIAVTPFLFTVAAGDYVQIVWSAEDNTTTKIETLAAGTTPTVPRTPGVIVLVNPVTALIAPTTVESLTVTGNISTDTISFTDNTVQETAWTGVADYNNLTNKPTIPAAYTFNVAADDSTLRTISTEETVKFIGAGGITTASDAEGAITITQGSTDQIIKVAGSFASDQPFKSEVIADLVNGVTINTWMGLPAFATTKSWKFGYNGNLTFPDTTVQTTAYTGNAATVTNGVYTTDTGTVTNTMLAGSIANDKLANSSITVNGTSISLGSSATILAANPNSLTIGTGLSGGNYTGNSAVTIGLASGYGDTQNPYASKTANNFLAAPNGSNGVPTFRAIVAADIPTLNQNTTGSAATLTTARNINGVSFNGSAAINIPTLTDGTNSIKITAVPSALTGAAGDVVGSVAFDSTYIYYCFQAFTGTSYSLQVISGLGEFSERVDAGSSELRTAIVAAFAATPAGWSYGGYPVNNITAASGSSINIFRDYGSPIFNGTSYTLIQPSATANWKITPWGATTSAAPAGSLTGNTLASGVTASSLTSFGATPAMTSPAITTSLTTPSSSFNLINTTATTVNFAGAAITLSVGAATGTTTINNNLSMASGKTIGTTATVTSNHTTAFSAGDSAISNVALSVPRDAAIRDRTNGASVIYFDVSNGGTTNGEFQFRSSSAFTNVLTMNTTAFNINTDAVVTARTPSLARTAFNAAMGTELTVNDMRFRITNSGLAGVFPQVISNASYSKNLAWTAVTARSGSAINQAGSTGVIVANNAWTSLYTSLGIDSPGDTVTVTLQDKALGRIYRVTFMRSDDGATDGFNIIAERLL